MTHAQIYELIVCACVIINKFNHLYKRINIYEYSTIMPKPLFNRTASMLQLYHTTFYRMHVFYFFLKYYPRIYVIDAIF